MRRTLLSIASLAVMLLVSATSWAQKTYEIGTAEELNAFALAVTSGETDANAVLTADIDYSAFQDIIGQNGEDYQGTFDGQGHKVTLALDRDADGASLFWALGKKGVIKNLITDGTIATSKKFATGIAVYNSGAISNCASFVKIASAIEGDGTHAGIAGVSYNESSISNCLSAVSIAGELTTNCGGIVGWLDGATKLTNNLSIADIQISTASGSDLLCRNNGNMRGGNNYFVKKNGFNASFNATLSVEVTEAQVASGMVAFRMNGDQTEINWYQTIGTDAYPVPFATSKQVYGAGTIKCNGVTGSDATFSNENTGSGPAPHDYVDGLCSECGKLNLEFVKPVNGVYQIGTASELRWFGKMIDAGYNEIDAALTADIDYTGVNDLLASGAYYKGTFDGQFHKITMGMERSVDCAALFQDLQGTVKNLVVDGTITTSAKFAAGVAAHLRGGNILNCTSSVKIISSVSGDGTHGGLLGVADGGGHIDFCVFNGSMTTTNGTTNCGGIVGWSEAGTHSTGCIINPSEVSEGMIEYVVSRNPNNIKVMGAYYSEAVVLGTPNAGTAVMTDEVMKSGEACFKMNGDQSVIGWTQNVGSEDMPNNQGLSKRVYSNVPVRCDGQIMAEEGASYTYSNDASIAVAVPDHKYENGTCSVCGSQQAGFMEPDAEGYYNISDAAGLAWYSGFVNAGNPTAPARLTADIDMAGHCNTFLPIGFGGVQWSSTFDGQGHKISNLNIALEENCAGLFGYIKAPCTIQNVTLDATCSISGAAYSGLIGESVGVSGDIHMINLGNEGTVTTGGANAGGIIGCCMSSSAHFIIENCYVTGNVTGGAESGAISGWMGDNAQVSNTWAFCEVSGVESNARSFARYGSGATFTHCYGSGIMAEEVEELTEDMLHTGELTWKLNGESFTNPTWFQTIGEDMMPVLDNTHGIVYGYGDGLYADVHDEASFKEFVKNLISSEEAYCDNVVAEKALVEQYKEALTATYDFTSMEEFMAGYSDIAALKDSVEACAASYAAYAKKVEETIKYLEEHDDFAGAYRDLLSDYLELDDEPNEDYPNGAALYILNNRLLSKEEVEAETEHIDEMLAEAIAKGYVVDSDITNLMANPTFIDGFDGWEGEKKATGHGYSTDKTMRAAEVWNNTMDMYQTVTGLSDGIYELQINGAFRPSTLPDGTNYAAMFYMNGIQNYFMADIEDMISVDDAIDGVNCNITGGTNDFEIMDEEGENVIGYVMQGTLSAANAFTADRYFNTVLAKVENGELTIGVKVPGTGYKSDWLGFGNIHLFYRGSMEQASGAMDGVLASMSARANTILNNYTFSEADDYACFPNYSQALKDALQETVEAVAGATEPEAKYELIQKFSTLFQEIYDCKQAYISMVSLAESLNDAAATLSEAGKISAEEADALSNLSLDVWDAYSAGSYTYEQATGIDALNNNTISAKQVDGVYQIANDCNLVWFSALVNSGNNNADGVLADDIDMTGINLTPIGKSDSPYSATFDGQGHKISNLVIDYPEVEGVGLFGFVAAPVTIKNLVLDNTCSITGKAFAGIVGETHGSYNGDANFSQLGNEGTVTTVNQNAGGVLGCCMSSAAHIIMTDCYSTGAVTGGNECGAVSGWVGDNANITNCWSITEVTGAESDGKYLVRCGSGINLVNCFSKKGNQVGTISDDMLTSGALTFTLNNNQTDDVVWYQTLGKDEHPVLFKGGIVFYDLGEYTNRGTSIENITIQDMIDKNAEGKIYSIDGRLVKENATAKDLKGLKGVYIIGNHKYLLK